MLFRSQRQAMLGVLAEVAAGRDAPGAQAGTASGLSQALSNARIRFFKRFAAQHGQRGDSACGLHFLIQLRADMLRWHKRVPGLRELGHVPRLRGTRRSVPCGRHRPRDGGGRPWPLTRAPRAIRAIAISGCCRAGTPLGIRGTASRTVGPS